MAGTAPGRSLLTTDALEASVSARDCRDRQACMGKIVVCAERVVDAPADAVYRYVADMRDHHPRFLPPAFSDFRVESGGTGAGTITRFTVTAGGRTREYRMKVDEPEPGRVLTESGHDSAGRYARGSLPGASWPYPCRTRPCPRRTQVDQAFSGPVMTGLACGLRSQRTVQVRLLRGARPAGAGPQSGRARLPRR